MIRLRHLCVALAVMAIAPAAAVAGDPAVFPAPSRRSGSWVARLVTPAAARSQPGHGRVVAHVSASTDWSHQAMVLLVLGSQVVDGRQWLQVRLPNRPNGSSGWIDADRAQLSFTRYWITVQKTHRLVLVYHAGKLMHRYHAVIGKPATPTPEGLYSIYERTPLSANGFLGSMALMLTAFSPTLRHFGGGPGRIAIHGRGGTSLNDPLGHALSHGCIRIDNHPVNWIANHAPRGTPVQITN
jgi:L,D-transpeptidase catalytic domain